MILQRCAEEHGYTPEQVDEYEAIVAFFETVRAIRERHVTIARAEGKGNG